MNLTEQALKEFEELWRQDHPNEEISKQELTDAATLVLHAVELVYKPIPKQRVKK